MDLHEYRRVADVLVGLFVLVFQHFEDPRVAADGLVGALRDQVRDLRCGCLSVAVDPPVALLENHQGPRHVEMDQSVALVVQVDAFRGNIRTDQQADRTLRVAEVLDNALLVNVAHPAVERLDLAGLELEISGETRLQPV